MTALDHADQYADDISADEIHEAIGHACDHAKRLPHVVGCEKLPTKWDSAHAAINDWLDLLDELIAEPMCGLP